MSEKDKRTAVMLGALLVTLLIVYLIELAYPGFWRAMGEGMRNGWCEWYMLQHC